LNDQRVHQHKTAVERLLRVICAPEELPWFVSDEATVFDVSTATESELLDRITASWGLALNAEDLKLPLWQLALRLDSSSSKG